MRAPRGVFAIISCTKPVIGFSAHDRPDAGIINTCVHCGICLSVCPTYRVTGLEMSSPRGRILLMKNVNEGEIGVDEPEFMAQMNQCLNCRACEAACPSGVRYGEILEASRSQVVMRKADWGDRDDKVTNARSTNNQQPITERAIRAVVFKHLFKDMRLFRAFAGALRVYQKSGAQGLARKTGLLKLMGMGEMEAMLPVISPKMLAPQNQIFAAEGERKYRVALLTGCIMGTAFARVHQATIRVLQKNGCEVVIPQDQGCCGALHTHGGDLDGGRELARANILALERAGLDEFDAVISNAAGCGSTLKEYAHLLHGDEVWRERAARWTGKVKDIHEFLAGIQLNTSDLKPLNVSVTFQEPCHLAHAQRITAQPRKLLNAIPGLTLREMPESALCCGSAGVYNITQPEMAAALGERKIENAISAGAQIIATANPGCALQLANELRKRGAPAQVKFIIELLDESYSR